MGIILKNKKGLATPNILPIPREKMAIILNSLNIFANPHCSKTNHCYCAPEIVLVHTRVNKYVQFLGSEITTVR
jgi:hypothetical protein